MQCVAELMAVGRRLGRRPLCSSSPSSSIPLVGANLPDIWIPRAHDFNPKISESPSSDGHFGVVINGKSIADEIKRKIATEITTMKASIGKSPGLAVVLVGKRRDSYAFIEIKLRACKKVGISSSITNLPDDCTEREIIDVLLGYNENPSIHGIIVQLPLPQHLNEEMIMNFISPEKDVDGFHPLNMGNLAMAGRNPLFIPCAAKGCIELLLRLGVDLIGKNAVVIGRSKIVGLPVSLLLQRHHATVSNVNGFTSDPERITREADIVVTDVGVANVVRGDWLKQGAVVIDTGTNQVEERSGGVDGGLRVVGDVCYEEAVKVVSAITPVPGGAGPVTISMLLSNTLESAKRAFFKFSS